MALPKSERLTKTRDIERVFKRSQRDEGEFVIIRLHKKSTFPGRATVIVSKAVSKRAVLRNILRRRIVEWLRVRACISSLGVDCVVSVKPAAAKSSRQALYRDLAKTARGLGITS
ncbi:MAG: ribonuclease P protein component [Candidatus Sungbacteria bacterium]|nr:ribonuclease P protein component [Candidatus Sungbacteria bacterium]